MSIRLPIIFLFSVLFTTFVHADTIRAGKWEGTFQLLGNSSESSNGEESSSLEIDSTVGFGFGIGYNFSSKFALNVDISFMEPEYKAVFNTDDDGLVSVSHDLSVFNTQINGVWNFMDGPLTPYVQAGIGWTYIDSNISDGPPTTGCWWDPWWGYVCQNFYDSYDDTTFSYGAGVGVRYEFGYRNVVKASYSVLELNSSGDAADLQFDMWRIEIGRMF